MDKTLLATAILSGPDAIISADRDGVITFWNEGDERIFGFTEAHAVGQSLDLIIPERLRTRHWAGMTDVYATPVRLQMLDRTTFHTGVDVLARATASRPASAARSSPTSPT